MFRDIARRYAFGLVAASTKTTYVANSRMWVSWRSFLDNGCWLQTFKGDVELVEGLVQIIGYFCTGKILS